MKKMNKKGLIFYWILIVVIFAIAFIYLGVEDLKLNQTKGFWSASYIRAFQQSETNLLVLDDAVLSLVKETKQELLPLLITKDWGCGKVSEHVLLNSPAKFCSPPLKETFLSLVQEKLTKKNLTGYNLSYVEGSLYGKSFIKAAINSRNPTYIPTERKSVGMFTIYEAYLVYPFYLNYEYNPSFQIKAELNQTEYDLLVKKGITLVQQCASELNLQECLLKNKPEGWKFSSCKSEEYSESNRQVLFCVSLDEVEFNFALDFTTKNIFSPQDTQVSLQGNQVKVSFTPVAEAESYKLYYTNWNYQPDSYPQEAKSLFFASQGSYFYTVKPLSNPAEDNCPITRQVNTAYRCGNQILYWLEDIKIVPGQFYYLTITALKNGEESLVYEVLKLDSSQ
ncbi:MAG: hypothetical protein AABX04_00805 [Nanoarchaeota archaeon]